MFMCVYVCLCMFIMFMYVYVCVCVCEPANLLIVRNVNSKAPLNPLSCFFFSFKSTDVSVWCNERDRGWMALRVPSLASWSPET